MYDRGVGARWEVCNDRGFARIPGNVTAVLDILDLVVGYDAADYRMLPVVVRSNHGSVGVV